jgi:hypothetical protein
MTAKSASAATAQAMNLSSSGWGHIPDSGEGRDEILHTHNDHGRFPAPVYDETLIILDSAVHDLPELRSGDMGIYAAVHRELQSID